MGGRRDLSPKTKAGATKLKQGLTFPYVTYISVKEYPSIQRTQEIRWLDTFKFGTTLLPAPLLYNSLIPKFCTKRGIPTYALLFLSKMVLHELMKGEKYHTKRSLNLGFSTDKFRVTASYLAHWSLIIKMPNNKGRNVGRYFLTALGQGVLNEFYGYCAEEEANLRKIIAERG